MHFRKTHYDKYCIIRSYYRILVIMQKMYLIAILALAIVSIPIGVSYASEFSMSGYEVTLEEYSQIWLEFDGEELKSAQFSLPVFESGEWGSRIYDLPNPRYSIDDTSEAYDEIWGEKYGKTFSIASEFLPSIVVLFNGEYVDEDTILIDAEIYFLDEQTGKLIDGTDVIKLQYLATI